MIKAMIVAWTIHYAAQYGVDPAFALAVAHVESRSKNQEFRIGLLGKKWYGPYNIHKDFIHRWPEITTIPGNCKVGVRALRGGSPRAVLKRYNKAFNNAYFCAVIKEARKYRKEIKDVYQKN